MGRSKRRGKRVPFEEKAGIHPSLLNTIISSHLFPLLQISEGGEDEDEDEAKEVYFVPQDPESRKCLLVHVLLV
jgi:hypothetical protein